MFLDGHSQVIAKKPTCVFFTVHTVGHNICYHPDLHCLSGHYSHSGQFRHSHQVRRYTFGPGFRARTVLCYPRRNSPVLFKHLHTSGKTRNDCLCPSKVCGVFFSSFNCKLQCCSESDNYCHKKMRKKNHRLENKITTS